mmetsp:Transcript_29899/g.86950  ORF Transcript_29899/g.86950 Transcript_29899/m.86950 type:complete len:222 (-) Transcript_29899:7-672(-)
MYSSLWPVPLPTCDKTWSKIFWTRSMVVPNCSSAAWILEPKLANHISTCFRAGSNFLRSRSMTGVTLRTNSPVTFLTLRISLTLKCWMSSTFIPGFNSAKAPSVVEPPIDSMTSVLFWISVAASIASVRYEDTVSMAGSRSSRRAPAKSTPTMDHPFVEEPMSCNMYDVARFPMRTIVWPVKAPTTKKTMHHGTCRSPAIAAGAELYGRFNEPDYGMSLQA